MCRISRALSRLHSFKLRSLFLLTFVCAIACAVVSRYLPKTDRTIEFLRNDIRRAVRLEVFYNGDFFTITDRATLVRLSNEVNWPYDARFERIDPALGPMGLGVDGPDIVFQVVVPSGRHRLCYLDLSTCMVSGSYSSTACPIIHDELRRLHDFAKIQGEMIRVHGVADMVKLFTPLSKSAGRNTRTAD